MSRIVQLPRLLANQIAAGEVITRPACIIKELVENSLDANATKIEVEIEGAGCHRIVIRDDGDGIVKDDLPLAFSRHATSKIQIPSDLDAIDSLGFRGEALASIACVARCRLTSRTIGADPWQITLLPDLTYTLSPASHALGTTVEVVDLFYNTPARRKFLRSEKTEFQAIDEMIKRLALSYPHVRFLLKNQGRVVKNYPPQTQSCETRLAKICGTTFAQEAMQVTFSREDLHLQGWLGLPQGRRHADCQYFFVNKRMVRDRVLTHAIKSAYAMHPRHPVGMYPAYVLYLTVPPSQVDVNVHPTKQEVRFSQARQVHDFISQSIDSAFDSAECGETLARPLYSVQNIEPSQNSKIPKSSELPKSIAPLENIESPQNTEIFKNIDYFNHICVPAEDGVILLSCQKVALSLWNFYFEKKWGEVQSKPLLFALPFSFPHTVDLRPVGFALRFEGRQGFLIAQPQWLNRAISTPVLQTLLAAAVQGRRALCEQSAVIMTQHAHSGRVFSQPLFAPLIREWIRSPQRGGVYLRAAQINKIIDNVSDI